MKIAGQRDFESLFIGFELFDAQFWIPNTSSLNYFRFHMSEFLYSLNFTCNSKINLSCSVANINTTGKI